jgi:cyclohexanone monooxygenase
LPKLTIFQRTPSFSVPAHNRPLDPAVREDWLANRENYRQQQRESGIGIVALEASEELALEQSEEDRLREFERRWAKGGFPASARLMLTRASTRRPTSCWQISLPARSAKS